MKLTIREYAKSRGVSYESVRKQIAKHSEELEEHIITENGTRVLTDQAQDILNQYSKKQVVVYETDETLAIKELKEQLAEKDKIIAKKDKELEEKEKEITEKDNKYNDIREQVLDIKEKYLDTQTQIAEERQIIYQSKFLLTQSEDKLKEKDKELELIATNRKERRKYIKGLKKAAKEEKKAAAVEQ